MNWLRRRRRAALAERILCALLSRELTIDGKSPEPETLAEWSVNTADSLIVRLRDTDTKP